ncbi:MAG: class D beta-lactamase [Proteobacteria bacterium]|nr:class D beta-lactamase [Pseudomonadota bacterium]
MEKIILLLSLGLLFSAQVFADTKCFLAKENNKIIQQEGDCQTRYTPQSTFKIALSLMGYDSGIFVNEENPTWPFKENYDHFVNVCKSPHNPRTWIRDSCVWYSQVLTQKLGKEKFKAYVSKFNYGNQNISGDKGKDNGLTNAWLSSSLEISPEEQTIFLQKLINNKLSVSKESYAMTKKILFREELPGGWKLYGKTGNGQQLSPDKTKKLDLQHGWFVGWIEKNGRIIVFANHIVDDKKQDIFASFRARDEAKNKLWGLIEALEQ